MTEIDMGLSRNCRDSILVDGNAERAVSHCCTAHCSSQVRVVSIGDSIVAVANEEDEDEDDADDDSAP